MRGKKMFLILGGVMLVIVIAASTTFVILSMRNNEESLFSRGNDGYIYNIGEFTVNVTYQRTHRFIRTEISVLIQDSKMESELNEMRVQIRDAIIKILRQSGEVAIEDPGARELKDAIRNCINNILEREIVMEVYFTEFVVQ